jgi:hypothetical protein
VNINRLRAAAGLVAIVILSMPLAQGQEQRQSFTWKEDDGSLSKLDLSSGWSNTGKIGTKTIYTPVEMEKDCVTGEEMGLTEIASLCDRWAELKPKTQIEQLPFSRFIYRLLKFSAPGTDFARYRGMELQSDKTGIRYDALLVPSDIGKDVSCTVTHGRDGSPSITIYQCSLKTISYPAAIEIEKALLSQLKSLNLTENQAKEHGLLVSDKDANECAPTGECTHAQMFISGPKDGKVFSIEAQPVFVRDIRLDVEVMMITGHHNFVSSVSPNSGTVEVTILSVASQNRDH